jgi:hypothetical protein
MRRSGEMQVTDQELLDELHLRATLARQRGPRWYGLLSDEQVLKLVADGAALEPRRKPRAARGPNEEGA